MPLTVLTAEQIAQIQRRPDAAMQFNAATGQFTIRGTDTAGYNDQRVRVATSMFEDPNIAKSTEQSTRSGQEIADRLLAEQRARYAPPTPATTGAMPFQPSVPTQSPVRGETAQQVERQAVAAMTADSAPVCTATIPASFPSVAERDRFIVANPLCREEALLKPIDSKPLWPWFVLGGVLVAGTIGGAYYYKYSKR